MRVFKTKWFVRYARREKIGDQALWKAIKRAERGIVDADLGKELAGAWLKADAEHLDHALQEGVLQEVSYDRKK